MSRRPQLVLQYNVIPLHYLAILLVFALASFIRVIRASPIKHRFMALLRKGIVLSSTDFLLIRICDANINLEKIASAREFYMYFATHYWYMNGNKNLHLVREHG